MNRQKLLALLVGVLAVVCFGATGMATVSAHATNQAEQVRATQTSTVLGAFAAMGNLCEGRVAALTGTADYSAGPGVHPLTSFDRSSYASGAYYSRAYSAIGPADWQAPAPAATQLIACRQTDQKLVEACPYVFQATQTPGGYRPSTQTATVERYREHVTLRLFAAKSGQLLAEQLFVGGEPIQCRDTEKFSSGSTTTPYYGSHVSTANIEAWLRSYVAP